MHRMDDLDVRIIRELGSPSSPQWNVRATYSSVAKRIGVDEETVRRRVMKAEKLGSVPGWRTMVNPRLLGCEAAGVDLEVADAEDKDKSIAKISRIDGVVKILNFRERGIQVTLFHQHESALLRKTELMRSICRSPEPTVWRLGFPGPEIRMTVTDWKIIRAILDDARRSVNAVSEKVGTSARTVERRLTAMAEGRALYLQGTPNFRMLAGLSCVFLVFCPDERKKKLVDNVVLSKARRTELSNTTSKQFSTFVMAYDNLLEADDVLEWIRGLDGVESAKMGTMKELIVVQDWMRKEIAKRLAPRGSGI